jgi:hypothetical protein
MNARLYDPALGRFLSPDPYVQAPDFSQSFNRYSYCMNNPLIYVDENGEFIISFITGFFKGLFSGGNPFKSGWQSVTNEWNIITGLFTSDKDKNWLGQIWEVVSRFTWQGAQTSAGNSIAMLANQATLVDKVDHYGGATTVKYYGEWGGMTLGSYIHGDRDLAADPNNPLFQHEYGHYLQSQDWGTFYFQRYAFPSFFSSGSHNHHPVEQDANRRAMQYFSQSERSARVDWNRGENPIDGYNWAEPYDSEHNMRILNERLKIGWYDWVLGPNIIINSVINIFYLNKDQ